MRLAHPLLKPNGTDDCCISGERPKDQVQGLPVRVKLRPAAFSGPGDRCRCHTKGKCTCCERRCTPGERRILDPKRNLSRDNIHISFECVDRSPRNQGREISPSRLEKSTEYSSSCACSLALRFEAMLVLLFPPLLPSAFLVADIVHAGVLTPWLDLCPRSDKAARCEAPGCAGRIDAVIIPPVNASHASIASSSPAPLVAHPILPLSRYTC